MRVVDLDLHDKAFPGPLGFAGLAGVKGTGLGILPPPFLIWLSTVSRRFGWSSDSGLPPYIAYSNTDLGAGNLDLPSQNLGISQLSLGDPDCWCTVSSILDVRP
jgi:hypothetical protein